ncbi:TadE/TadG family type IV pilus assembly protein [Brachybacterium fresconis]|uniref:Membrane protein n=1 Tax=Brachybacterium fresconis TaxID=173363 RepID=A0ABS4YHQ1_9MICO|nr:Tad domain-containing protein [Brachybacterium fresconis]MBP2408150.1 putative membrane protein [Brachybacterium fresconis]
MTTRRRLFLHRGRTLMHRLRARLQQTRGSITILTTGVLVVILMVIGVGTAITGVHLERTELQHAADSVALAASQAVDPERIYVDSSGAVIHTGSARRAAEEQLRSYPIDSTRTEDLRIAEVSVDADGTVRVVLTARTHPPLAGWLTRRTGTSIPLTVEGEARAR